MSKYASINPALVESLSTNTAAAPSPNITQVFLSLKSNILDATSDAITSIFLF